MRLRSKRAHAVWSFAVVGCAAAGCDSVVATDVGAFDAGPDAAAVDTGQPLDAGADTGGLDGGRERTDVGTPDAGSDAGAPDVGSDAGPAPRGRGFISVEQASPVPPTATSINVSFVRTNPSCVDSLIGPCEVSRCIVDGPDLVRSSAGVITVSSSLDTAMLTPSPTNTYPFFSELRSFWGAGGGTVTVAAEGVVGDVPPFSISFAAPANFTLTAPIDPPSIARNADMVVSWTGGTAGTSAFVLLSGRAADGAYVGIVCRGPSEAGSLSVPTAALMTLGVGSSTFVIISSDTHRVVEAGEFDVEVSLSTQMEQFTATAE